VVDSADLPLNVSRELLQESRDVKTIREGNARRVLTMLDALAKSEDEKDQEQFTTFYREFGSVLKEGLGEDFGNRERILKLLRFSTSNNDA
ncbi:molecular chaperone HtpG, partial [bacterium LRH843]|nr:molecular chaperone HtpG [bacterium LRH843]